MSDFFHIVFSADVKASGIIEAERQRIIAITPFDDARAEAIRVVRGWTRALLRIKAEELDIIDLQDPLLNGPAEQAVIDSIRAAFGDFLSAANAAATLSDLNAAWQAYKADIAVA